MDGKNALLIANFINSFRAGGFLRSRIPCFVSYGVVLALVGVLLYKYILRPRLGKVEKLSDAGDGDE